MKGKKMISAKKKNLIQKTLRFSAVRITYIAETNDRLLRGRDSNGSKKLDELSRGES